MLGDFKPQTLVFSRFWRPDVQNQSVGGALPPRKVLGEGPPSLLAAVVPTSVPRLWPRGSSLGLHGHPASSSPQCLLCGSLSHLPLPRNCKDTCGLHLGPTQLVGVKSFLSRFLTKSPVKTQIFLPNKVTQVPRRRQWQPTPVLLPGPSHGPRSLVGCSPWGRKESDMTE